jgi:hypothetical protein
MLLDSSAVQVLSSDVTKPRKPHPIVGVVQKTASELNDLLNAVCGEFKLTLPPGFERGLCSAVASDMSRGVPSEAKVHRSSERA